MKHFVGNIIKTPHLRPLGPTWAHLKSRNNTFQLYDYFQNFKLFYRSQYGFRNGHSTEAASLELVDTILTEMDSGQIPICIFLYLSKGLTR